MQSAPSASRQLIQQHQQHNGGSSSPNAALPSVFGTSFGTGGTAQPRPLSNAPEKKLSVRLISPQSQGQRKASGSSAGTPKSLARKSGENELAIPGTALFHGGGGGAAGANRGSFRASIFAGTINYQSSHAHSPAGSSRRELPQVKESDGAQTTPVKRPKAIVPRRRRDENGSVDRLSPSVLIPNMILRQSSPSLRALAVDPEKVPLVIAAGMTSGAVALLDIHAKHINQVIAAHHASVVATDANLHGRILSCAIDGFKVWNPSSVIDEDEQRMVRRSSGPDSPDPSIDAASSPTSPGSSEAGDGASFLLREDKLLKCIHSVKFDTTTAHITCGTFMGNGRLVTGDSNGLLRLYNSESHKWRLLCEQSVSSAVVEQVPSPSSTTAVAAPAAAPGSPVLASSQPPHQQPKHKPLTALVSFDDGSKLATCQDGVLKLWSSILQDSPNAPAWRLELQHSFEPSASAAAHHIGVGGGTHHHSAVAPHHHNGAPHEKARHSDAGSINVRCMLALPEQGTHGLLLTGHEDRSIRVLDLVSLTVRSSFHGHFAAVTCLAELNDHRVVSGSLDSNVKIWNLSTSRCDLTLRGHTGPVTAVCATWYPMQILSASTDGSVRLWNLASGACEASWILGAGLEPRTLTLLPVPEVIVDGLGMVNGESNEEMEALRLLIAAEAASANASPNHSFARVSQERERHMNMIDRDPLREGQLAGGLSGTSGGQLASSSLSSTGEFSASMMQQHSQSNSRRSTLNLNSSGSYLGGGGKGTFGVALPPTVLSPELADKDARLRGVTSPIFEAVRRNMNTSASPQQGPTQTTSPPFKPIPDRTADLERDTNEETTGGKNSRLGTPVLGVGGSRDISPSREREKSPSIRAVPKRVFDASSAVERASLHSSASSSVSPSRPLTGAVQSHPTIDGSTLVVPEGLHDQTVPSAIGTSGTSAFIKLAPPAPLIQELMTYSPDQLSRTLTEKHRKEARARTVVKRVSMLHEPRRGFKVLGFPADDVIVTGSGQTSQTTSKTTSPVRGVMGSSVDIPTVLELGNSRHISPVRALSRSLGYSASEPRFSLAQGSLKGTMSLAPRSPDKSPARRKTPQKLTKQEAQRRKQAIEGMIARIASPTKTPARAPGSLWGSPSIASSTSVSGASSSEGSRPAYVLHQPTPQQSRGRSREMQRSRSEAGSTSSGSGFFLTGVDHAEDSDGEGETKPHPPKPLRLSSSLAKSSSAPSLAAKKRYILGGVALQPPPPGQVFNKKLYGHLSRVTGVDPKTGGLIFAKRTVEKQLNTYIREAEAPSIWNGFKRGPGPSNYSTLGGARSSSALALLEKSHAFMSRMTADVRARQEEQEFTTLARSRWKSKKVLQLEQLRQSQLVKSLAPVTGEDLAARLDPDEASLTMPGNASWEERMRRNNELRAKQTKARQEQRQKEAHYKRLHEEEARLKRLKLAERAKQMQQQRENGSQGGIVTSSPLSKKSANIRMRLQLQIEERAVEEAREKQAMLDAMTEEEREEYHAQQAREAKKRAMIARTESPPPKQKSRQPKEGWQPPPPASSTKKRRSAGRTKPEQRAKSPGERLFSPSAAKSQHLHPQQHPTSSNQVKILPVRTTTPLTSERSQVQREHDRQLEALKEKQIRARTPTSPTSTSV